MEGPIREFLTVPKNVTATVKTEAICEEGVTALTDGLTGDEDTPLMEASDGFTVTMIDAVVTPVMDAVEGPTEIAVGPEDWPVRGAVDGSTLIITGAFVTPDREAAVGVTDVATGRTGPAMNPRPATSYTSSPRPSRIVKIRRSAREALVPRLTRDMRRPCVQLFRRR